MIQSFLYPGRLPGMNEIIAASKAHRMAYSTEKKRLTDEICLLAMVAKLKPVTGAVIIRMHWHEPNGRRDVDNVTAGQKFILDGLVAAKVLPDDSRKWVRGLEHRFPEPDKDHPRIVVEIIGDPV